MSENLRTLTGLLFKKLDLHTHTPASEDFHGDVEPKDIVDEALRKGLDGIAITDHNTGEWIDRVKEAAEGTELVVFPGVEITCMGGERNIHIIALFDSGVDTRYVNAALAGHDLKPDELGKPEALVKKTPIDVIKTIQEEWDGIAVLAHTNSTGGVLCDMKGTQRTKIVRYPGLLAVEATDFQNEEKRKQHKRVVDLLDGTDPVYRRKLAVYQASDNPCREGGHCLDGIGTRCACFKLEHINLEGLRQCFADPDVRIRQDYELKTWKYPQIKQVKVSGGFLGDQTVEFHSSLNSILGGKGAGKSILIELMRFGLGQPPDHPDILADHKGKLDVRLGEYEFVEMVFIDETGKEFHIKRVYRPLDASSFEDIPYDPAQVMPVLFLSQNEIIKIAENEAEQLGFIDRFFDFRSYKTRIQSMESRLGALDKKMAEGLQAFSVVRQLEAEIASLEIEVSKLDGALKHPLFEKYRFLEQKHLAFEAQSMHIQTLSKAVEATRAKVVEIEIPKAPTTLSDDPALRRNQDTITRAQQAFEKQLTMLTKTLLEYRGDIRKERKAWLPHYERTRQEYEDHVQKSGGDYRALARERVKKVRDLEELNKKLAQEQRKKDKVSGISEQREGMLNSLEEVYRQYTEERQVKCDKFQSDSAGRLQLRILGSSNVDEFRQQLLDLKQGSYLRETEIEDICSGIKPQEFIISLLRYAALEKREGRQPKHLKDVAEKAKIPLQRMTTLAEFLIEGIDYEHLLALQYRAVPLDRPEILYNIGDNNFAPLHAISVGQKSIALLLMALSDGEMPIVIDQPEDSLDIRSIWEDICLKLRKGKERRQFIFTTHSSSVAVASDTDNFIIMEGTATQGRVVYSGSMDHEPVGEEVLQHLEGGIESYGRKFMKYRADKRLKDGR